MKFIINHLFLTLLVIIPVLTFSQVDPVYFKSGKLELTKSFLTNTNNHYYNNEELVAGHYYRLIQFNTIPTTENKEALLLEGFDLLMYIPINAYFVEIDTNARFKYLNENFHVKLSQIEPRFKLSESLTVKDYKNWATNKNGSILLNALYWDRVNIEILKLKLTEIGVGFVFNDNGVLSIEAPSNSLNALYQLTEIYYFEQIDSPSVPENQPGVKNHRSNTLLSSSRNGLKYDGSGVTVMLQDNSKLDQHIDYTGRFFNSSNSVQVGNHGEHCGGTIAGAGNLAPQTKGMAPGSEVLVYNFDNANYDLVPGLITKNDLTITSKSYGQALNRGYNSLALRLDKQTKENEHLIHVFSAGNSNSEGETNAGSQWYNITGGHKAAKNVIAVGNLSTLDKIVSSSSRGPSKDGRIKPDICAVGLNVVSTIDTNTYEAFTGTSMSCPGMAGVMAQLYHGYKDINGGENPPSALMKCVVLNTADDLGNPGPDYIYGWGRVNARRAFNVLKNKQYESGEIKQGKTNIIKLEIPEKTEHVKIMVYWADYEGSVNSSIALVNDINIEFKGPNSTSYLPWTLKYNFSATSLNLDAKPGIDDRNNMEQITIIKPVNGTYELKIKGTSIPEGPQKYYVVYEFITNEVVLTYPIGGENLSTTDNARILWDAYGDSGTFKIEFSNDGGENWKVIKSSAKADSRSHLWNVDNEVTGKGIIKVTRNGNSSTSSDYFSIINIPKNLIVDWICDNYMQVSWDPVTDAIGYEVSVLGEKYMDAVGKTQTNSMVIPAPSSEGTWWSVRALGKDNSIGERADAVFQEKVLLDCQIDTDIAIFPKNSLENDLFLSCSKIDLPVSLILFNYGKSSVSSIPLSFKLNNYTVVNQTYDGVILPGDSVSFSFDQFVLFDNEINKITVSSAYVGDEIQINNTFDYKFNVNSSSSVIRLNEDFEDFNLCNTNNDCGLTSCPTINDFVNQPNGWMDDIDWRTNEGGTPVKNSGPEMDFNPGQESGNYMYIESSTSEDCDNKTANLVSPCIDLTMADTAYLNFAYHMLGEDIGKLHIDILFNGNWVKNITTALSGDQGQDWLIKSIDLTKYLGQVVNLRFRAVTKSGNKGNIAIDDIEIHSFGAEDNILDFSIFPNPSTEGIYYFLYEGLSDLSIRVHDTNGKLLVSKTYLGGQIGQGIIDLSVFAQGVYIISFNNEFEKIVRKVVKQ